MDKHTPTPWHLSGNGIDGPQFEGTIATASSGKGAHQDRLNAAFIVRAVNAHGDLIAQLKRAIGMLETRLPSDWKDDSLRPMKAAIAKAEGK